MIKKPAPYSEYLMQNPPCIIIFMGDLSWDKAADLKDDWPFILVLPPWTSPTRYDWPVNGQEVYLINTSKSNPGFIRFCVVHFLALGATSVKYISNSFVKVFCKHKDV